MGRSPSAAEGRKAEIADQQDVGNAAEGRIAESCQSLKTF